jgi:hypothetical protein
MEIASGGGSSGGDDQLHGLKFGKKIYFEDADGSGSSRSAPPLRASPRATGGGRRGAAGGASSSSAPPARCQVEGCHVDLTGVKTYYYRHKVCSAHSKTPVVIVAGIEQRFCQQCSRSPAIALPSKLALATTLASLLCCPFVFLKNVNLKFRCISMLFAVE